MSLTDRQRRFINAYLIEPNGKRAAITAGYSPATAEVQASRLLRHVEVRAEMARCQSLLSLHTGITPEMVVRELAKIGFANITDVVKWRSDAAEMGTDEETGEPLITVRNQVELIDSDKLKPETAAAISEISQTKDGALKIKMHDKPGSLVKIGQHLGMFSGADRPAKPAELGKKEQAQIAAAEADSGTEWAGLVH